MAKKEKRWFYIPSKAPKPRVPELVKIEVKKVCDEFAESVLKSGSIDPDPQEDRFNYIGDIYTKWYGNYLYFYAKYRCPGPDTIEPFFETRVCADGIRRQRSVQSVVYEIHRAVVGDLS